MPQMIFVNLPVKDLDRSVAFFKAIGYEFDPKFTDETSTCMVISGNIFAMLHTHAKFREFAQREVADSAKVNEVILALSADSRAAVDELVDKALAAGGKAQGDPQDLGFMYMRPYRDLDGHLWEIAWMDPAAIESGPPSD